MAEARQANTQKVQDQLQRTQREILSRLDCTERQIRLKMQSTPSRCAPAWGDSSFYGYQDKSDFDLSESTVHQQPYAAPENVHVPQPSSVPPSLTLLNDLPSFGECP